MPEGVADGGGMVAPGGVDGRGVVGGRDQVGGAVRQANAGAGQRDLHDMAGEVAGRVGEALLGRGQAAGGGVVEDAEVGAGEPAARRIDHAREGQPARMVDDRLGRLDLDLEPQPIIGQAEGGLQPTQEVGEGGHVLDGDHLGEGDDEAVGQPAGPLQQGGQEHVQGPDAAMVTAVGEGLDPQADERRQDAGRLGLGHRGSGDGCGLVLHDVVVHPVAVLEVDPEVLDRFAGELGRHPVPHGRAQAVVVEVDGGGHGPAVGGVGVEQPAGLGAERRRGPGREAVGGHVDGVDRLAAARVARVAPGEGGGGRLDPGDQVVEGSAGQRPGRDARIMFHVEPPPEPAHVGPGTGSSIELRRCRGQAHPLAGGPLAVECRSLRPNDTAPRGSEPCRIADTGAV